MRVLALALALAASLAPGAAAPALADGTVIEREVTLAEVVAGGDVIVAAMVRRVRPRWDVREAYGIRHRFRTHVELELVVTKVLKGDGPGRRIWIHVDGDPTPGKWEIVAEHYPSTYDPRAARRGDKVVAILGPCCALAGRRRYQWATAVESAAKVDAIATLLATPPAPPPAPTPPPAPEPTPAP